jgi:phage terminase large subunit-like protein
MHEREPSISCYGVQTGITGCHFDRIFFDDIVTQKNIGTDIQIQKVRQFVEDSLFLLDPGGKVLDVGTRWHFADAHGAILDGTLIGIDSVSLCFATIDGEDSRPMYPYQDRRGRKYGFTREGIKLLVEGDKERGIEPISNERFSSQYRNQPIESRESLFPRDRWGFFDIEEHTKWIERTPHTRWCLCDPAIKKYPGQQTGDFAFACVIDCMVNGEWRILDGRHGRYTIDELLDALDSLNRRWQPNSLGIEEGQYEHTLKYAAEQRGLALPIFPIKGQMNRESKTMRCQRITGKQKAGHIKIPGNPALQLRDQYWDIPDWARTLIEEAARFPKGVYDDCIDTLGYGPDVIYPPLVEEVDKKELATLQKSADILDWIEETGERQVHPILGAIR